MKNLISTFFIISLCTSLFAQSGKIMLSGKVQHHSEPLIVINHLDNQKVVAANLDATGNFTLSAEIEEGYFIFSYGRHTSYIYLYPNDELKLVFDAKQFESTLVFSGKGAERNNYLAKKSEVKSLLTNDLEAFYKVNEVTYLKNIDEIKNTLLASLSTYDVEKFFNTAEVKSLEYERLLNLQNYTSNYKFYLGEEVSPSSDFFKPIKSLKLNDEDDYRTQPYYRYLVNSVWSERIEAAPDVDGMLEVFRKVPSQAMANSLAMGFYSEITSNKERSKDYLDLIKRISKNQRFIEAAEKKYREALNVNGLSEGDPSPQFNYESVDGKFISLNHLKGKYVYIDVWATWCMPCLKQVPYLQQLEERYHNKNIIFVSISVDKKEFKDAWKKMVADKQMGGLQLFADNAFDSEFMDAYAVNSIPRFILIDPQGNIVNPEAPQPSFEKTKTLLDGFLN